MTLPENAFESIPMGEHASSVKPCLSNHQNSGNLKMGKKNIRDQNFLYKFLTSEKGVPELTKSGIKG